MSKTEIASVVVVGSSSFWVGQEVNGLVIHKIIDHCFEAKDGTIYYSYLGKTIEDENVFCVENAPVEVKYRMPATEDVG